MALSRGWGLGEVGVKNIRHDSPCAIALFPPHGEVLAAILDRLASSIAERQIVGPLSIADIAGAGRLYLDGMASNQKARHREKLRPYIANRVLTRTRWPFARQNPSSSGVAR